MKPIASILAICLAFAATTSASPLAEPNLDIEHIFENPHENPLLEKRGYGCNCIGGDDEGICNLHCLNNVRITCSNGSKIKPYKGVCGGFCTATCQCVYNKSCP